MQYSPTSIEVLRWGFSHLPGAVFFYAKELELDMEDIGILAAIFYAYEQAKPLFQSGVRAGQILSNCSILTSNKLRHRLQRLTQRGVIEVNEGRTKNFAEKIVRLEPLMIKLEQLVMRDHPDITSWTGPSPSSDESEKQTAAYIARIKDLEEKLSEQQQRSANDNFVTSDLNYKRVADFIAKKTGNLLSVKMENELKKWLTEFGFEPEFLLCMLELCFERKITNPREITVIVKDLKKYAVNSVDGLDDYFREYVDSQQGMPSSNFDPEAVEFGKFTGLDMSAEARRQVYNKWRYDWGFSHQMLMKAGELMCKRTNNGSLEYIDSILKDWMSKEIRSLSDVEKEVASFKNRSKSGKTSGKSSSYGAKKINKADYEFYVPPEVLAELKSKV